MSIPSLPRLGKLFLRLLRPLNRDLLRLTSSVWLLSEPLLNMVSGYGCNESDGPILRLAESNLRMDFEVVRYKRMLAEARRLRDSEVAWAAQKARREASKVFLAKFKVA